ncbi:DUF1905 domain-containing protein [Deinococcus psychrotolerans]|uniref:DUF1905 domain-containing protein n=1 Tax=Deinococcus psychrotolerans TaxID=2489213 RepID=UPI001F151A4E|nr:DUF1905 domain-containing protein [Deinococcus psychrotolerans]
MDSDFSGNLNFSGEVWFWRGPAPWYFVSVPEPISQQLKAASPLVTYGWGMIPVKVELGQTVWATSLFPKEGLYLVPIKASVRASEHLSEGDEVSIRLTLRSG